jgi:hypothetical protein
MPFEGVEKLQFPMPVQNAVAMHQKECRTAVYTSRCSAVNSKLVTPGDANLPASRSRHHA